jgi:hypothetical protein
MSMSYEGSCHCGKVAFQVDGDLPTEALSCNCSYCRRKGLLLTFVPADRFTLSSGSEDLQEYRFNSHRIEHLFCRTCGTQSFSVGRGPDGAEVRAINLRCVPAVDLQALKINPYDGASH